MIFLFTRKWSSRSCMLRVAQSSLVEEMDGQDPALLVHPELRVQTSRPQEMKGVGGC